MNPIQKMLRSVGVYTKSYTEFRRAERIGFIRSRVNKTPIRYETESDTLVIRYRVNGALTSSSFDKMAVDTRDNTRIGIFMKCVSFGYNMKESQRFVYEKKYDNAQIKSENRLVSIYHAILYYGNS